MNCASSQGWLARFAWLTVLATATLIVVGSVVTTLDYGLAVPDWPTSFGTFNPPGWWHMEGVNWEHGHRLLGAIIGLLVIILVAWTGWKYRRSRIFLLTFIALIGVIIQGVLGGLRVTEVSTELAIVHGCFAQAFFALLVFIAASLTRQAESSSLQVADADGISEQGRSRLLWAIWIFMGVAFSQVILGALMRHYKAGLAIPDFPLAMGRLIPPLESFPVIIHYSHRLMALVVVAVAVWLLLQVKNYHGNRSLLVTGALCLLGLLLVQIVLGAAIVLSLRATVSTSLHVLLGAATIGSGAFLLANACRLLASTSLASSSSRTKKRSVFELPVSQ